MESLQYNNMSNAELQLEKLRLTEDFENKKKRIADLYRELDELDRKYIEVERIMNNRRNISVDNG